jgi:hypothetical protein
MWKLSHFLWGYFLPVSSSIGPEIQSEINRKVVELFSCIFGFGSAWTEFWTGNHTKEWEMTPTAIFGFPYKMGFFPNGFLGFLVCYWAFLSPPLLTLLSLLPLSSLQWFLHIFEGFGRGDLDLQSPPIHSSSKWEESFELRSWSYWLTSTLVLPL